MTNDIKQAVKMTPLTLNRDIVTECRSIDRIVKNAVKAAGSIEDV